MESNGTPRPTRRIGTVLIFLPGLALAFSAILKFAGVPAVVHQMAGYGFVDGKLLLVAALEILSAGLFLYARTRSLGVLLLSSFFGGVVCTHVQMGEYAKALAPSLLVTLAWVGTWLQHPETLWSFGNRVLGAPQPSVASSSKWASKRHDTRNQAMVSQ